MRAWWKEGTGVMGVYYGYLKTFRRDNVHYIAQRPCAPASGALYVQMATALRLAGEWVMLSRLTCRVAFGATRCLAVTARPHGACVGVLCPLRLCDASASATTASDEPWQNQRWQPLELEPSLCKWGIIKRIAAGNTLLSRRGGPVRSSCCRMYCWATGFGSKAKTHRCHYSARCCGRFGFCFPGLCRARGKHGRPDQ